jgi:hypothetical protein
MRKFLIFGIIFIAVVTFFVYIENNSIVTFNLFGAKLSLPNAVWMAIFLSLFFVITIIFISFTNLKNMIYRKNVVKDVQVLIENIKNAVFYKKNFKETKIIKEINDFVKNNINGLQIKPEKTEKFEFLEDIKKLLEGETIDVSAYKLSSDNPWFIQNVKNRLKKEPDYAKEILKKFKNEELKKEAFYVFAKTADINEIVKYDYPITKEIILSHIKDENLKTLLEKAKLNPKEEIEIARALYGTKNPDEELETIKPLKWGYAYLALKYEHLELAKEIIEANELKFFDFFLKIREVSKVDIDEYLESEI